MFIQIIKRQKPYQHRSQVRVKKRGGFGIGLATLSSKTSCATETATKGSKSSRRKKLPESSQVTCMNDSSQSRKDAADRMADVLSAKTTTHIGFWNVRTMFDAGKLAQVCKEMRRYNLDILGISETRWTSSGRFTSSTGETILILLLP